MLYWASTVTGYYKGRKEWLKKALAFCREQKKILANLQKVKRKIRMENSAKW